MVACTRKQTVQATESSQYDCFRKPAAYIISLKTLHTHWEGGGGSLAPHGYATGVQCLMGKN